MIYRFLFLYHPNYWLNRIQNFGGDFGPVGTKGLSDAVFASCTHLIAVYASLV